MKTVLVYDVVGDARRTRLFKRLKGFLRPVQKSVFEGGADEAVLKRVEGILHGELDLEQDQVRIYRLCAACAGRLRLYGPSLPVPGEDEPQVF
jgi:CRISPR-associated protein Cas2